MSGDRNAWRFLVPVPACCLLQAIFGLLYATGVFVALIDRPQYTLSIGVAGFFTSVGITVAGVAMNKLVPTARAQLAPVYVALFGTAGMAAQVLCALALALADDRLLFFGAALYGMGCGCIYVASVDVLQAWVPEARGTITGVGMLCGAMGSLFGIEGFRALAASLSSPIQAIALVGFLSAALTFAAAPMLQRPPAGWHPNASARRNGRSASALHSHESLPLVASRSVGQSYCSLGVKDILMDPSFYLLVVAFAGTVGPGFGIVLAFQEMAAQLYGADIQQANSLFFWVTFSGIAGRLLSGIGVDALDDAGERHAGMLGAKRTNKLLLAAQLVAVLCMPLVVRAGSIYGFMVAAAVVYVTFSGGPVVTTCLVGGVFNQNNASLAFSLIAISIGLGDMFFSWIIARCSEVSVRVGGSYPSPHVNDYNLFIVCSALWSIAGYVATHYISRCRALRDDDVNNSRGRGMSISMDNVVISMEDVMAPFERATRRSADETLLISHADGCCET